MGVALSIGSTTRAFLLASALLMECLVVPVFAQTTADVAPQEVSSALPRTLDLATALSLAQLTHPDILNAEASALTSQLDSSRVDSRYRWQGNILLDGRVADRAHDDSYDTIDDSRAELAISKLLWGFGDSAIGDAARIKQQAALINVAYQKRLQRVMIIARFLEVLAADQEFAAENEAMSLAYFPYNRANERRELFDSESEVTVLALQATHLKALQKRNATQHKQRAARQQLALAMALPGAKPLELLVPDLSAYEREQPDYDVLIQEVLANHPLLRQHQTQNQAITAQSEVWQSRLRPQLTLRLHAGEYEQSYSTKDARAAMLQLSIPLLDQGRADHAIATLGAEQTQLDAASMTLKYQLRTQVLNWVQRLDLLDQIIKNNEIEMNFRERVLDKARLLYELEVRAQIGQAQADMAKALWEDSTARYERAVIWEQIDALLDTPPAVIK